MNTLHVGRIFTSFGAIPAVTVVNHDDGAEYSAPPAPTLDTRTVREVMAELEGCDPNSLLWLELPAPIVLKRLWRKLYRDGDHERPR